VLRGLSLLHLGLCVSIGSLRSKVAVSRLLLSRLLLLLLLLLLLQLLLLLLLLSLRLAISVLITRLVVGGLLLLVVALLSGTLLLARGNRLRLLDDRGCRSCLLRLLLLRLLLLLGCGLLVVLLGKGLLSLGLSVLTVSLEGVVSRSRAVCRLLGGSDGRRGHLGDLGRGSGLRCGLLLHSSSRLYRGSCGRYLFLLLLLFLNDWLGLLLHGCLLSRLGLPGG